MSTFQYQTRGSSDQCSLKGRNAMNESIFDYMMTSLRSDKDEKFAQFVLDNPNLRFTDGHGMHAGLIDSESELKKSSEMTHGKDRRQMNVRTFVAVPDLSRGETVPVLEHILKTGETTVEGVREVTYNDYPLNKDIEHMIYSTNRALDFWEDRSIGESSKVILNRMKNGHINK